MSARAAQSGQSFAELWSLGEYCHLVMLWRATREERELYETNS
jgi:hypothetical protein